MKKSFSTSEAKAGVRLDKLRQLPDKPEYFFRRLNCLNAAAIRQLPSLDSEHLNDFLISEDFINIQKNTNPQQKIKKRITEHLAKSNAVVLKGPPGTGKTYIANTCYSDCAIFFW